MGIGNFADDLVVYTLDIPEVKLGKFVPVMSGQLAQARIRMFFNLCDRRLGFTLKVYSDSTYTAQIAVSDIIRSKNITELTDHWLGDIAFSLIKPCPVLSGQAIYLKLDIDRSDLIGDTNYVGVVADWPLSVDANTGIPPRVELFINQIGSLY